MLMNDMGDDTAARTDEHRRFNITITVAVINALMFVVGLFPLALPRLAGVVIAAVALVGVWLAVRGHRRRNGKLVLIAGAFPLGCLSVVLAFSKVSGA
ncbi:hypothetical protein [Streptomyces coerulescens]|uniref:Uncharacterized protein n=1 Tax=Streptomyces coerulescens TaxID=29304 RepID=A0ABW0CVW3_STRCD